jgi:hypothetical protein
MDPCDDLGTVKPHLSRGSHMTYAMGTCVMELASVLAGEPFSDRPECVHPTLAKVARMVNDQVGDDERQRLVPLLPQMMSGPRTGERIGLIIALSCLDHVASDAAPRKLTRHRKRVLRQLEWANSRQRLSPVRRLRCRLEAHRAIDAAVVATRRRAERALTTMLTDVVRICCWSASVPESRTSPARERVASLV